jgi:hypothetical protein
MLPHIFQLRVDGLVEGAHYTNLSAMVKIANANAAST